MITLKFFLMYYSYKIKNEIPTKDGTAALFFAIQFSLFLSVVCSFGTHKIKWIGAGNWCVGMGDKLISDV